MRLPSHLHAFLAVCDGQPEASRFPFPQATTQSLQPTDQIARFRGAGIQAPGTGYRPAWTKYHAGCTQALGHAPADRGCDGRSRSAA